MTVSYALPQLNDLKEYMRLHGWLELAPGPEGSFWTKNASRLGIPRSSDVDDMAIEAIVERVARVEHVDAKVLSSRARHLWTDITRVRIAHDFLIADSIPLSTALIVVASVRSMLRAVGTTAVREQADIRSYHPRGDEVMRNARMAHTEQGSFIIPILTPIEPPAIPDPDDVLFPGGPPEPFERRVTRTFAQSLQALQEIVVVPARDPGPDAVLAMVERGVSRDFCKAVAKILAEKPVAEFESDVEWAPALEGPERIRTTTIEADASEIIERAAQIMKSTRMTEPSRTFSGQIVGVHRGEQDPVGVVFVSTIRKGRPCEIRVSLPAAQYVRAVDWHRDRRPVLVEGDVSHDSSRRLFVSNLIRCYPLDETQLSIRSDPVARIVDNGGPEARPSRGHPNELPPSE